MGLNTWLTDEKNKLLKEMEAKKTRKRRRRVKDKVVLPDNIEQKLRMGLNLLKALA